MKIPDPKDDGSAEDLVSDLAENGISFDLNPAMVILDPSHVYENMCDYLQKIDRHLRDRAKKVLELKR